jgi:glycosyltransferase involved in cell wall biosynthesis
MVVRSCAPAWFAEDPPADVCGTGRNAFTFFHGKANSSRGTGVVLKALEHTKRLLPDIKCIMFNSFSGSANEINAFQQQVTGLGLNQEVDLREGIPMQQMPMVLRECDAGLIAYGRELGVDSLPNKLFEYMAAGLPIIAPTYSPEICRIIESENCGITADFEDPQSVSKAMLTLAQNPDRAREMGQNSRKAFEQRHNWEVEVHPLIDRIQSWFLMQEASQ